MIFSCFRCFCRRGRGKSAAIGLCLAGAIAYGYSNIFVTAPSPENLSTVFEFVLKGFDLLHFRSEREGNVLQLWLVVVVVVMIHWC